LTLLISLASCVQKGNQESGSKTNDNQKSSSSATHAQNVIDLQISYENPEQFTGVDSLYQFKSPKGLFRKKKDNLYESERLDATIEFISHYTDRFDQDGFFKKQDLINSFKRGVRPDYFVDKDNWFVLSYDFTDTYTVYLKGFYDEMISMQGRDEGEPSWLWSKSGVLKIKYNKKHQAVFGKLIPFIIKSFSCNLYIL
jgi:hypothetical protein